MPSAVNIHPGSLKSPHLFECLFVRRHHHRRSNLAGFDERGSRKCGTGYVTCHYDQKSCRSRWIRRRRFLSVTPSAERRRVQNSSSASATSAVATGAQKILQTRRRFSCLKVAQSNLTDLRRNAADAKDRLCNVERSSDLFGALAKCSWFS